MATDVYAMYQPLVDVIDWELNFDPLYYEYNIMAPRRVAAPEEMDGYFENWGCYNPPGPYPIQSVPNLGAFQVTPRVSRDNFRVVFGGETELDSQSKQIMQL